FGVKSYEFPRQGMTEVFPHFERKIIQATTSDLHLSWDVPYEAGIIKVIGRKDGRIVCEEGITTAGEPSRIEILADRSTIISDGLDVCHITVKITDESGHICPLADNLITFEIVGEGTLIGVDNGRPDSHESFKANYRHAFNGMALAIIQSNIKPGAIHINASSTGLNSGVLTVVSV
ncbi:MAG TPA: DUF4982 domain-containing protein, partial [Clostridiaceae bacterium]